MNSRKKLSIVLLFAFIFVFFSAKSDIYAEEFITNDKINSDISEIKLDKQEESIINKDSVDLEDKSSDKNQVVFKDSATNEGESLAIAEESKKDDDSSEASKIQSDLSEEAVEAEDKSASSEENQTKDLDQSTILKEKPANSEEIVEAEDKSRDSEEDQSILNIKDEEILDPLKSGNPNIKDIYLDGLNGDDNNDGSKAFKTFAKAKEFATKNQNIENIYVVGTTDVEGEVSLEGTKAKLIRGESFTDYLLKIGAGKTATLKNILIDGNSGNNSVTKKALVYAEKNSTLTLGEKSVLQNNKIKDVSTSEAKGGAVYIDGGNLNIENGATLRNNSIEGKPNDATMGGAICAYNSIVNMTGGIIEENQATYGGGIYLYKSTMNFSDGTVQENRAELVIDKSYGQIYSAGGGIALYENSTLNMSGQAKVLNNFAAEIGGGISVGTNQVGDTNTLKMTGGIIDGNTAGASGGGIFIQAKYFSGGPGKAYITAGRITNNNMDGSGITNKAFGGGGIYVNGAKETIEYIDKEGNFKQETVYGANGELYIKNVLITDNSSKLEGAGMAACPISKTKIYVNDGAAIYNNKAGKDGNDLYIYSNKTFYPHNGEAKYELSKQMLGGAPFNWTKPDGKTLTDAEHKGTLVQEEGKKYAELALDVNSKGNEFTNALAKVIISGNYSATRGGGIGSNGSIVIGTDDGTTEVSVEKKWDDNENKNNKRPDTVKVELLAKYNNREYLVETREIKRVDGWKITFENLPAKTDGQKIEYTIREVPIDGYEYKLTGDQKKGFTITNIEKPEEEPKTRDIKVRKDWEFAGSEKPVDKIEVELYRDGQYTGKSLELNAANKWSGVFKDLAIFNKEDPTKEYKYSIKEVGENNGLIQIGESTFEVTYEGNMEDGFIITNKEKPEKPPENPPHEPPETPPETPPGTPPETPEIPEEPSEKPEIVPEKPEVVPEKPKTPDYIAPKTFDSGIGSYLGLGSMASTILAYLGYKKRKRN